MLSFKTTLAALCLFCSAACQNIAANNTAPKSKTVVISKDGVDGKLQTDSSIFQKHVLALKKYAAQNGYSQQYIFMVDLALHSGNKRFFVVDIKTNNVVAAGLVTHGSSKLQMPNGGRKYSNVDGCYCSSLGKYKIGQKYNGQFGVAYKLYGLQASNSNAYKRAVVLHSHPCVPAYETDEPICQSWGCPTVSPSFLKTLAAFIDASDKPILMEIFDSGK